VVLRMNPCNECIVLAMCKARFNEYIKGCNRPQVRQFANRSKCQLLREHLYVLDRNVTNEMREFYGLLPIPKEKNK